MLLHFGSDGAQRVGEGLPVVLRLDEPSVSQRAQMCSHDFFAQANRFTDDSAVHFVRAAFQTLAADQIDSRWISAKQTWINGEVLEAVFPLPNAVFQLGPALPFGLRPHGPY